MNFSIKNFFSKCDQIRSFLRIWSHLLKKPLMENFIFCAVTPWLTIDFHERITGWHLHYIDNWHYIFAKINVMNINHRSSCPEVFLKISQNSQKSNCVADKKRFRHRCFPVNFANFLRAPFPIEHLRWLLLLWSIHNHLLHQPSTSI